MNGLYDYEIIWERDYEEGYGNCRVKTDKENNVIVCGLDREYRGLVVKYDKNGNLLWNDHTLPKAFTKKQLHSSPIHAEADKLLNEAFGSLLDLAIDSENNIVVVGSFYDSSGKYCNVYVKKYSPDGNAVWEKTLSPFLYSQATGIDIDSQDNIFIAGYGGTIIPPSVKGFVIKLSKYDGRIIWKRVRRKPGKFTGYTSIVSCHGDVVACGFISGKKDYDLLMTKFGGKIGKKKNEMILKTNVLPGKIVMDEHNNFFVAGQAEGGGVYPYSHYLLKVSEGFTVSWEKKDLAEGALYDVAIMKDGNIAVTGKISGDEYYAGIYSESGDKLLDMLLGKLVSNGNDINDWMKGIAIDKEGDLLVVGAAPVAKTIKVKVKKKEEEHEEGGEEEEPEEEKKTFIEILIEFFRKLFRK